MTTVSHNPPTVSPPSGGYTHGLEVVKASRLLFISGQIPERPDGQVPEDFAAQCETVWTNIEQILHSAGMSVENLVKVTTFLTDRQHAAANREIRQRHLKDHKLALTVIIAQTLDSQWLLEIEAIAASND